MQPRMKASNCAVDPADLPEIERFQRFCREHPAVAEDIENLPVFIHGVGGKRMALLDSTLADFRAHIQMLESRIRRNSRVKAGRGDR